jgi:pimeloyl-ACP methyl ester carboxylesterase
MGRTPAPATIAGNDDVVDVLLGLIDRVIGDEPFLVVGQSYGGYLARAIANRRPHRAVGLALICPVGSRSRDVPSHAVLHSSVDPAGVLGPELEAEYRNYLVVQTPETLRRFQEYLEPAAALVDRPALERIFGRWELSAPPEDAPVYPHPALILTGRQDASAGFASAWDVLEHYPRATFAVLDRAGHALLHEQLPLVDALVCEWLARVDQHMHP